MDFMDFIDFADLLETNIDLYQKNQNLIISYVLDQRNRSSYANKLFSIGENTIKKYLFDNPIFMEIILNEIIQRKILIKIYKKKLEHSNDNIIKTRILKFGMRLIKHNSYKFKNEHQKIFKKNMIII